MAFISRGYAESEEQKRQVMTGAARRFDAGGLIKLRHGQTYYRLDGNEHERLLICIHGWSTASYVWEPLRPLLRDLGYRLLTYDLYGRGFSDRPDVANSAELFSRQLAELLERLGLSTDGMNIVGYSMGGAIAARFVSERLSDVERLLFIAPAGMAVQLPVLRFIARRKPEVFDAHIMAGLQKLLPKQFRREAKGFLDDEQVAEVLRNQNRELNYRGYLPSLVSSLNGVLASRMMAEHRKIAGSNVKVRALFADEDGTIPFSDARDLFDRWQPGGRSRVLKGAGHGVTYTHPDLIMEKARDLLVLP
ncbi:MAG: alpha/beta hydrolase [Pseudomonadota bacterium]